LLKQYAGDCNYKRTNATFPILKLFYAQNFKIMLALITATKVFVTDENN